MAWFRRRARDARFGEYAAAPAVVERPGVGIGAFLGSLVYAATALTELLVAIRFLFRLFAANPGNDFVSWVYNLSGYVVAPFAGIFGNSNPVAGISPASVWEWGTVIAFIVWGIVGTIIARALTASSRY